jgi:hypothetical protein
VAAATPAEAEASPAVAEAATVMVEAAVVVTVESLVVAKAASKIVEGTGSITMVILTRCGLQIMNVTSPSDSKLKVGVLHKLS